MHKFSAKNQFLGKQRIFLPSCESTNELAKQMAQKGLVQEGFMVITDQQTRGKGQRGNSWESEPNMNATFSVILTPTFINPSCLFDLNIISSLAIARSLSKLLAEHSLSVKWPNDIYVDDRKVGGILIENIINDNKVKYSIIGIGLNVNQMTFNTDGAVSLKMASRVDYQITDVVDSVLSELDNYYSNLKTNRELLTEEYLSKMYRFGERHTFRVNGEELEAKIIGISELGKLLLEDQHSVVEYDIKEVQFVF